MTDQTAPAIDAPAPAPGTDPGAEPSPPPPWGPRRPFLNFGETYIDPVNRIVIKADSAGQCMLYMDGAAHALSESPAAVADAIAAALDAKAEADRANLSPLPPAN